MKTSNVEDKIAQTATLIPVDIERLHSSANLYDTASRVRLRNAQAGLFSIVTISAAVFSLLGVFWGIKEIF